jgi:PKD repeat protein
MKKLIILLTIFLSFSAITIAQLDNDIQTLSINCPNGIYYYGEELQFPSITVKNCGINEVDEINVYYSIDEGTEVLRNLTALALQTDQTRTVLFPQIELSAGEYTISARVEIVGIEDDLMANNILSSEFSLGGEDIGIGLIQNPLGDYCGLELFEPAVWVINHSTVEISTFTANFRLDFYPIVTKNVTETIAAGDSVLVVFDAITLNSGDHSILFNCANPNGHQDSNTQNNSSGLSFNYANGKQILISIMTDTYGSETSWDLKNSANVIVAQGSGYAANTLYVNNLCLMPDCYVFTIYDSFGDGICAGYGNGYYLIEDVSEKLEIGTGCNFTYSEMVNFCITTPPGPPIASFSHSTPDNCSGVVEFYDYSACNPVALSWLWNFGDGTTSVLQNPIHTYTMNGYYNVSLQVTSLSGTSTLTIPNSVYIAKEEAPVIADEHFCFGENVTFFAPVGIDQLHWYVTANDEDAIQIGPNISFASLYNDTTIYYDYLPEAITANVGLVDNTGLGGFFNFGIDRAIYFDALSDITIKTATVFASGAANRTFTLKNSGGVVIDTRVLSVPDGESIITLNFEIPAGDDYAIHVNTSNNLSYTGDYGGPNVGYPFTVPDLISITGNNYSNSFWYFLYNIEVQEGFGTTCVSARTPLHAIMSPQTVSLGNDTTVCNGNSITLTPGTEYSDYEWNSGSEESSLLVTESGLYSVTVNDIYSCLADGSINITIADELVYNENIVHLSAIGANDGSIEIEIISGSEPYEIYWNDANVEFIRTDLSPGIYSYTVTDGGYCEHIGSIEIYSSVAVNNTLAELINIYPNPANDVLNIISTDSNIQQIRLFDLNSKLLLSEKITNSSVELNISHLKAGVYILNITGEDFTVNRKIIKE